MLALWHVGVPAQLEPAQQQAWLALLSDAERSQLDRFHFDALKRRYLLTRVLVRRVLSQHAPLAPQDWRFENNAWGRPQIADPPPQARDLRFNVSHTESRVVLAVARGRELGVDVEDTRRRAPLDVARRFFSPAEAAALLALPPALQVARFWDLWTLKESYIKARGMGLSLALDAFTFHFDAAQGVQLQVEPALDDGRRWQFLQHRLPGEHLLALCVEQDAGPLPGCRFVEGLPDATG